MFKKLSVILSLFLMFSFVSCTKKEIPNLQKTIICFGDSLTEGKGANPGETYPDFLQKMTNIPVINLGVSGNTSMQGLLRIDEVVNQKAFLILVEFGANDFFKKIPMQETKQSIEKIVDKLQATGATVVLVSTEDTQLPDLYNTLKKISKDKKTNFIDGMLNDIWDNRSLFSDNLHPNSNGYKIVAEKIFEKILPLINN
ncbi:MAG: GDSL-type esterase/lipase family protein [Endomicrobiaceae bacterium]|nr:GDSL-type esterase/lipase family protein [Endomicrobiaceae bacterium]MDD3923312.1 GDSL-type esterase/lipase family protein [Endomicrobiaceae bacterium]